MIFYEKKKKKTCTIINIQIHNSVYIWYIYPYKMYAIFTREVKLLILSVYTLLFPPSFWINIKILIFYSRGKKKTNKKQTTCNTYPHKHLFGTIENFIIKACMWQKIGQKNK